MKERALPRWVDSRPNYERPIAVARSIAAPADRVREAIPTPGSLELWHPFCAKNPVQAWPGEGSRDEVYDLSGWRLERRLCRWIDEVGYDLEIGRSGGGSSFASWRMMPVGERDCILARVQW